MGDVVEDVVDHVLADALLAAAAQVDDGRGAGELAEGAVAVLELVALDLDRKVGDQVEGAHGGTLASAAARPESRDRLNRVSEKNVELARRWIERLNAVGRTEPGEFDPEQVFGELWERLD